MNIRMVWECQYWYCVKFFINLMGWASRITMSVKSQSRCILYLNKQGSSYYELDSTRCSLTYLSPWMKSFFQRQVNKAPHLTLNAIFTPLVTNDDRNVACHMPCGITRYLFIINLKHIPFKLSILSYWVTFLIWLT